MKIMVRRLNNNMEDWYIHGIYFVKEYHAGSQKTRDRSYLSEERFNSMTEALAKVSDLQESFDFGVVGITNEITGDQHYL